MTDPMAAPDAVGEPLPLQTGTPLHDFLLGLRGTTGPATPSPPVWSFRPVPGSDAAPAAVEQGGQEVPERPFLSIVMRTQGRRLHCLTEALTCLAGQTSTDFEVLVVGHRLGGEELVGVERVIADLPAWLRERTRLVRVDRGKRATPLNEGFAAARGRYIAILDDDDIPFGHWVQTFAELAQEAPGQVLRTVAVQQDVVECDVRGTPAVRAVGPVEDRYPEGFDFIEHLRQNFTPNTALAFPREVFHDLGIRFDEDLTTTEDWDFIMRTAAVAGVASRPTITCLYRWWVEGASSRTDHDVDEWDRNMDTIVRRLDGSPLLFPAGSVERIRALLRELDERRYGALSGARADALVRVLTILESTSWRVAAPVRAFDRLFGRRTVRASDYVHHPLAALIDDIEALESSRSWRWTSFLRH